MIDRNIHITRQVRGIPLWLLREYLQELGGKPLPGGGVEGEGWSACLVQVEDFTIGSIRVGQVRLELEATSEAWDRIRSGLENKLMRAGG